MKTTLSGIVFSIGTFLKMQTKPSWLPLVGEIVQGIAIFFLGYNAQDAMKSKKQ